MSMEQAKLFIERMVKDEAFRNKIMGVDDVAERMQLVKTEGYDCASEEIETMFQELRDAEVVDGVSGGCEPTDGPKFFYPGCPTATSIYECFPSPPEGSGAAMMIPSCYLINM